MIWMFPLYLLGAAAVVGPILMHLRRKPPQERVEFSSLMFLEAQTPVPVSKRRLERWLLLLLRCLALVLLALMFARPVWQSLDATASGANTATLVLVDRSASMRRATLWQQAVEVAGEEVRKAAPADRVALAVFDREPAVLWSFEEDAKDAAARDATAVQRLTATKPGWAATDLGQALVDGLALFGRSSGLGGLQRRVVLVTDLQEGARLDALRGLVWPENTVVQVRTLSAPDADNFTLSLAAAVTDSESGLGSAKPPQGAATAPAVRVRLTNARDSRVADYTLGWEPGSGEAVTGYLPAGASRVVSLPPSTSSQLKLKGDAWDFDNQIYVTPAQPLPVNLAFIGDEATRQEAASPLYYLSRGLQTTPTLAPRLEVLPPSAPSLPKDTHLAFVSGPALTPALAAMLKPWVEAGGLAIVVAGGPGDQAGLRQLSGLKDLAITEAAAPPDGYLMLGEVDGAHPLLRPFADPRLRDFTKMRFWRHRKLGIPAAAGGATAQVIARFDQGDPAMAAVPVGRGTLLMLAAGWHPADSQLALSTKFVPLLYGWLEAAGFRNETSAALLVGDLLPIEGETTVMTPEGQTLNLKAGETHRTALAGIYTLSSPRLPAPRKVAVNLPPEEGRVVPMDAEKLREFGVRLDTAGAAAATEADKAAAQERLAVGEQEGRQRAWLWLLAALLAILALETWLAGRVLKSGEVSPRQALS